VQKHNTLSEKLKQKRAIGMAEVRHLLQILISRSQLWELYSLCYGLRKGLSGFYEKAQQRRRFILFTPDAVCIGHCNMATTLQLSHEVKSLH
jgi:hypothetical protein